MGSVEYREIACRTALNRVRGMPFDWSLNPYRGCAHACTYCYAREYFRLMGRDPDRGFDREVEVKIDFVDRLRAELRRAPRGAVALGTSTDPYQPCEGRYRLTRGTLQALLARPMPLVIITKGTLVVRDADLLAALSRSVDVRVLISIGSVDAAVARVLEPATPPPDQRLRVLSLLRAAGVRAGVICAPIVPGLSDSEASLEAVARAASAHGAWQLATRVLKLDAGERPGFVRSLAEAFPALVPRYEARYQGVHLDPAYARALDARIARVRSRWRFPDDDAPPAPDPERQLQLAI